MLSGNITAAVVDGHLFVWGDAESNHVIIDQADLSADQYRVEDLDGTTNGDFGPVVLDGVTGNVVVSLGRGTDTLIVGSPGGATRIRGNLTVHTKRGGGFRGDLFTEADNQLTLAGVQVDGRVDVIGPFGWIGVGAYADTSFPAYQGLPIDTTIGGHFTARGGLFTSVAMTAARVDGSVRVHGVYTCDVTVNGGSVVGGDLTVVGRGATAANLHESLINGHVRVFGGREGGGVTADLATIGGSAYARFGSGDVTIDVCRADIGGNFHILPGAGPSHIRLGYVEDDNEAGPLIGGDLYINTTRSLFDEITLACTGVVGNVILADGRGELTAEIAHCTFDRDLLVRKPAGYGDVSVSMAWVNHNAIFRQGAANVDVTFSSVTVANDLTLLGGGTADTNQWTLEDTDIYGGLTTRTGGRHSEIMQTITDVSVGGNATFVTRSPYASVVASDFDVMGHARVINGPAAQLYLNMAGTIDKDLIMQLGGRRGWISTETLDVHGDVQIRSGGRWEGEVVVGGTIDGSLFGRLGGQEAYLDLSGCAVAGDARMTFAYRRSLNARLGMADVHGDLVVASIGASDDTIDMGGLSAEGTVTLRTGRGADDVYTDDAGVGWGTWIHTGGGDDIVVCSADLLFAGADVRTGAGSDRITVAAKDWDGGAAAVRGFGSLAVRAGGGNDEIVVNLLDEVDDPAALAGLLFAGGGGRDSMQWNEPSGGGFGAGGPEGPRFWSIEEMTAGPAGPVGL